MSNEEIQGDGAESAAKPQHTLGEILATEHLTAEEQAKRVAKGAPIVVIAIMIHVIVAAVLGMMYLHQAANKDNATPITMSNSTADNEKIEEKPPEPEKPLERTAIPEVENTDITEVTEEFSTVVDDTVNPYAQNNEKFGMSEGTEDNSDLMTMSTGGKGLAGAIGVGAGSGAGGGMRKGNPMGGSRIGRRNAQKGQLEATEKVVMAGLDWLKRHQSPDGSWDASSFLTLCDTSKGGARCEGRGGNAHTAGLTGLALLAYLGAGYDSSRPSPYIEVVKNGLKWLRKNQDAEGCFGPRSDHRFTYSHACATLAMCEAYDCTKQTAWKTSAQQGIDFIAACQNPYKAWRYGKRPGDNDSSVTGWMLMALKSAKNAGLTLSETALKQGADFINEMTDRETGRTGYTKPGEHPVRPDGLAEQFPGNESESLTAVGMCGRIFADTAQRDIDFMKKGQELLEKRLPVWEEKGGKIDMYYWYYGTLAMYQMAGSAWDKWNKNLKTVVVDHQHPPSDGCQGGSWDPKDPWAEDGGRIYSTCLMTLCLEVYYRYPRVFGTGTKK